MDGVITRKNICNLTPKELDNFVRAFVTIQQLPPNDPNSFFIITGYHGKPFQGASYANPTWWGGYCNHGNVLFLTWHHAYVHRFERALQSQVPGPQNWKKAVADDAKRVVTEIWNTQYKPDPHQALTEQSISEDGTDDTLVAELDLIGVPDLQVVTGCCELEDYLMVTYKHVLPFQFWAKQDEQSESGFLNLAKMAHDFLAIPATSVSSERSFSKGRACLPYTWNRLGGLKMQQEMLLN
ncbi:hypothetical protein CPC16_005324, partial [Podila verticillata]